MSIQPPPPTSPRPGVGQNNQPNSYRPVAPVAPDQVAVSIPAPTLLQWARSDKRGVPGQRPPRWAGTISFWVGLLAALLLFIGGLILIPFAAAIALALGAVAGLFGLVALIAGIGRGAGFFGILLALLGNYIVIDWVVTNFLS